jgi:transcription elongation GreA/GreB family factor
MGASVGDTVTVTLPAGEVKYKVLSIEKNTES